MSGKPSGVGRPPPAFTPGTLPAGTQGPNGAAVAPTTPTAQHSLASPARKLAGSHEVAPRSQPPALRRAAVAVQAPSALSAGSAPMPLAARVRRVLEQAQARRVRTAAPSITLLDLSGTGVSLPESCSDLRSSRAGWQGTPDGTVLGGLSGKAHLFALAASQGGARFPMQAAEATLTDEQKRGLQLKLHARARRD